MRLRSRERSSRRSSEGRSGIRTSTVLSASAWHSVPTSMCGCAGAARPWIGCSTNRTHASSIGWSARCEPQAGNLHLRSRQRLWRSWFGRHRGLAPRHPVNPDHRSEIDHCRRAGTLLPLERKARLGAKIGRSRGWEIENISKLLVVADGSTNRARVAASPRCSRPRCRSEIARYVTGSALQMARSPACCFCRMLSPVAFGAGRSRENGSIGPAGLGFRPDDTADWRPGSNLATQLAHAERVRTKCYLGCHPGGLGRTGAASEPHRSQIGAAWEAGRNSANTQADSFDPLPALCDTPAALAPPRREEHAPRPLGHAPGAGTRTQPEEVSPGIGRSPSG
jgi:hypothetical protein